MGLIAQAKADIERITSSLNEWAVPITFVVPGSAFDLTFDETLNTDKMVTLKGLHTKHHLGITEDQRRVNTKNASVTIAEKFLTDIGYPVRVNGEVQMRDHKVFVKDSTGTVCFYVIREWFPDETVGLIVFILGDAE